MIEYPFANDRYVGTVTKVNAREVTINLPYAAAPGDELIHGESVARGRVGEFVVIENGGVALLGRISEVSLPEKDRLSVEPHLEGKIESHPIGTVRLLTTIVVRTGQVLGGISSFPRVGSKAYSANVDLLRGLTARSYDVPKPGEPPRVLLPLARIAVGEGAEVEIGVKQLFGRHCAIVGSTGGGKSWTIGKILEECSKFTSKIILIDATGEFSDATGRVDHISIGYKKDNPPLCEEVRVPYRNMEENDLFAFFTPGPQVARIKLRDAIKSLKLVRILGDKHPSVRYGCFLKTPGESKTPFIDAYNTHAAEVEKTDADFEIKKLANQIIHECIFPTPFGSGSANNWGGVSANDLGNCYGLIGRIEAYTNDQDFSSIFGSDKLLSVFDRIDTFIKDPNLSVLRISLKFVPFSYNIREIIVNTIGRYLLRKARSGSYLTKPVVAILDEAHQFLDQTLGEEGSRYRLDSFELIAKEGRKYSLNVCLATQRPRDIPEGVLSQMGTFIVHRLTNHHDREVIEKASGDIDKSAVAFLPTLSEGEALIVGVEFPIPLPIKVTPPSNPPNSQGPKYGEFWKKVTPVATSSASSP